MPKVSVLMPVYNTEEIWLRQAIESILNQSYKDFEFIIINDGSTNNVKEVILSYDDERIKYIEHKNHGLIYTLNKGLSIAQGEYIARMDSDDISLPERFAKQVDLLDNNKKIGVVGAWIKYFPKEEIIQLKEKPRYLDILKRCELAHPVVMFKKEIFVQHNLKYEDYKYAEDYELWSRLIKCTQFYNIQEVLLNYRVHPSSISQKFSVEQQKVTNLVRTNILDFLTDDINIQQQILKLVGVTANNKIKYNFFERIISIKNQKKMGKKYKVITLLGVKLKLKASNNS